MLYWRVGLTLRRLFAGWWDGFPRFGRGRKSQKNQGTALEKLLNGAIGREFEPPVALSSVHLQTTLARVVQKVFACAAHSMTPVTGPANLSYVALAIE